MFKHGEKYHFWRKRLHTEKGFPRRKAHANPQELTTTLLQKELRWGDRGKRRDAGNWKDFLLGFYFLHRVRDNMEVGSWRGVRDGLGTCMCT